MAGYDYTASIVEMVKYLETLLSNNATELGIEAVYYGDQNKLPVTPAVCVESGNKQRELAGAPRVTKVTLTCYVIIYFDKVVNNSDNAEAADTLAESIEALIHKDSAMGDRVIDSLVVTLESGYQKKLDTLYRASRLTVEAHVKVILPSPPMEV